jgi:replicative DNA helicase
LGRFLYSLPASLLGRRDTNPAPVLDEVIAAYRDRVLALLKLPFGTDEDGGLAPHVLDLEPDARARLQRFEAWLEPQLAEFGALGNMTDWAGKLVGAVGRIAWILHMAALAGEKAPWEIPISRATIERAIEIGGYLIPHARATFAEMGADAVQDQAKRILRWIEQKGRDRFTKRDLHQALKGTFSARRNWTRRWRYLKPTASSGSSPSRSMRAQAGGAALPTK